MTYRKAFISLCGINFFVYGLNAIYNAFIPLYLDRHFDEIAVGTLLSIGPIIMIISPMFWGVVSDKAKYKNSVLLTIVAGAAVVFFLTGLNQSFVYTAVMLALFMFFAAPYGGLIDTITLEASENSGLRYGPLRLQGTVGYGIIAIVASLLPSSNEILLFAMYAAIAIVGIYFIKSAPPVRGHATKKEKVSLLPLIRDKNMTLLLIIIFVLMFAFSYYCNFMPQYMTGELNLPTWVWGVNVFVTLAIEFPFFIWFDKIFKKLSLRSILIITVIISAARYLLLGVVRHPALILLVAAVTGAWITVAIYCGTYYINATVSDNIRASGQSYMYAVAYGAPKVIAGIGGGIMTKYLGVRWSYYLCAIACLLCVIAAIAFPKLFKKRETVA